MHRPSFRNSLRSSLARSKNSMSGFPTIHGARCFPPWTGSRGQAPFPSSVRTRQTRDFRSHRVDPPLFVNTLVTPQFNVSSIVFLCHAYGVRIIWRHQVRSGFQYRIRTRLGKVARTSTGSVAASHLMGAGPTTWDTLYVRFRQHKTDEVAHTLRSLARWNHITVEADSTTRITASGANQLQHCSA